MVTELLHKVIILHVCKFRYYYIPSFDCSERISLNICSNVPGFLKIGQPVILPSLKLRPSVAEVDLRPTKAAGKAWTLHLVLFPFSPLPEHITEREYTVRFFWSKDALVNNFHIFNCIKRFWIEPCYNIQYIFKLISFYN